MKLLGVKKITSRLTKRLRNSRGNAMVETLPMIIIFITMLAFSLGFFTVIHTAIMNSMAARTYAFETFRNRSDVTYFRDSVANQQDILEYSAWGNRVHAISSEKDSVNGQVDDSLTYATARNIAFGQTFQLTNPAQAQDHNSTIYNYGARNRNGVQVNPAWVMVAYGICLDSACGDSGP